MDLHVLIPVRPLEEGKSRLAAILSPEERAALNHRFLAHVIEVCRAVLPAERCWIVSRSAEVLAMARATGAQAVEERGQTLNPALTQAAKAAACSERIPVLALSTDLPRLSAADLKALIEAAGRAEVVIAPDKSGTGTNALLLASAGLIPYQYGPDSFAAHREAARRAGSSVEVVKRHGLAFDVDTPVDLSALGSKKVAIQS